MASSSLWHRFQRYFLEYREIGSLSTSAGLSFRTICSKKCGRQIAHAFAAMRKLEAGAIANPTEARMVGHYWPRNSALAPTPEIRPEIEDTIRRVKAFAQDVHTGKSPRNTEGASSTFCTLGSVARRWGRNSCQPRSARQTIQRTSFSSIIPIPKALIACLTK